MDWDTVYGRALRSAREAADYLRAVGSNGAEVAAKRHAALVAGGVEAYREECRQEWQDAGLKVPADF